MKAWKKILLVVSILGMAASCHNDPAPAKKRIEKITFEERAKTLFVGDTIKVNIKAEPAEAKKTDKIEYSVTEKGIIEIKEDSGNDGVVFEGIKRGATIISANVNGLVDYCEVTVLGGSESVIPHIIVPYYVMECRKNERRSIVASLAGGTPLDDSGFVWSYTNQNIISLESTGNVGVFDTLNIGDSIVTISHPKAQFSVDVLVYVIGNDESPVYITTEFNVINLKTTDSNYQFEVSLRGGDSNDYYGFTMEVLEGNNVIDLRYNNNIGTINPKERGIARIGISHSKAAYRMDIVVIVNEEIEYRYINVDKTLVMMEEGYEELLKAELVGDAPQDYIEKYSFETEDEGVISVLQSHDHFSIKGLKKGKSTLKIKNEYADFDREVLVIVNGTGGIYDNEVYITTNQNVITTEAGGDDVILKMTLVGGNEADRNNFIWTVDDGSIISVESAHGRVEYKNRSIVSNIGERFEAQAVIKAHKVGTAKITLENPKAKNSFSVIVKVYKKGIFDVVPVVIDGPGVYKVKIGERLPARLQVVTGNERNLTNVAWTSENSNIVSASGAGLSGILEGKNTGVTGITVSGNNVKHDYRAIVIVGDDSYLETMPFMYALNPFISVIKGQSIMFKVMCENMSKDEIAGITVSNNAGGILEVFAYKDSVTVTGLELGEGELIINSGGLNTVKVTVTVEDYAVNPDMPYYLRSDKAIYGIVKNNNIEIGVNLVGASAVNEKNIIWNIEDSNIVTITGNGRQCLMKGKSTGQTVLKVSHPKSHNELEIVIYVVENENDLTNKIVIHVKEQNMLLNIGESRYISVVTNADDMQKSGFQWIMSDINIIDVNISGDRTKAYIEAKTVGSATITIRHSGVLVPAVVYVSVLDSTNKSTYINVPSIVEMAAGESMNINAVTSNIHDKNNIMWSVKNSEVAAVYGSGDKCLVNALKSGDTVITVQYAKTGFVKDVLLYVYNSVDEMASRYIMAGSQSRYVINEGDIINAHLVFGMKGYPEHELANIRWGTEDATVIAVTGNGKNAQIKGLKEGIGFITVSSNIANSVKIEVEVLPVGKNGKYWFNVNAQDRIKGIVTGSYADIVIRLFNGNNEIFNVGGIEYIVEHDDIISVAANGNGIRVHAASGQGGQSYITLRHSLAEDARILIYTAISEYDLENTYPLLTDKANYLIKKGDSVNITIQTKDNDNSKLNNISYGLERNGGVISIAEKNKREIIVNADSVGNDVILMRYNTVIVNRIYVSVTEGNYASGGGYMVTENIIGLLLGTVYETTVNTNAGNNVFWETLNDNIIGITGNSGKTASIGGYNVGSTVLKVRAGSLERSIVVFVCANEEELKNYQAVNIDQRYFRMRKQENLTINVYSYQGKVEGTTVCSDYYGYDSEYGNVIQVNTVENNKISVKGVNEGIAAIRVSNSFYNTDIIVYVEVANAEEGEIGILSGSNYITAAKTLYVIDMAESNIPMSVSIVGNNFTGEEYWKWSGYDGSIINLNYIGAYAVVNPLTKGTTKITVSNIQCENTIEITVIVGDRFVIDNSLIPYIYVEKSLYEVTKNDKKISIPYNIINVDNVNYSNVGISQNSNIIGASNNIVYNCIDVDIYEIGIARFEIFYGNLRCEVYILVKDNMDYGNVYLTTSENYVIATVGELRTINVQLKGYEELNSNNYTWSVNNGGVIQLAGNGVTGQIYGVGEGEAVITVGHEKAKPYDLKINVKIVKDKTKEKLIYLTTQRNIIETVMGNLNEQIYVQKVGGTQSKQNYYWSVSDSSIIELYGQGNGAQFAAKKDGVARITVYNEENVNFKLEIVVIVKRGLNNGIYISTPETLIMLAPGDMQRKISVALENGDVKDNNKYNWEIINPSPSDPEIASAGEKVISIVGSNEECFINALNEGVARIKVNNEKAELPLYITVYVTYYKEIQFSVNKKAIIAGENEFVGINLPTYEFMSNRVEVWSNDPGICQVYYTNEMVMLCGKSAGTTIIRAKIKDKEEEAQLLVNVENEINPNTNSIIISKSLYVINPKSQFITVDAKISGPNIFDNEYDNIQWETSKLGIVDIVPLMSVDKETGKATAKGRQVQISPKGLGTVNITVGHSFVEPEYWKQICIINAELNNTFRKSKEGLIEIGRGMPVNVSVEIVGGTTRDYAEVKWIARPQQKWDGTMLEVVRVMGSGKEVMLYPINDGVTEVHAMYGNLIQIFEVKVASEYYFNFQTGNEFMYPGEQRDLPFDVKPAGSNINWINVNNPNEEPVVIFGEVIGGSGNNIVRNLHVEAKREGTTSITGMANGRIASVNIIVKYDYGFNIEREAAGYVKYNGSGYNHDGITRLKYTVYPPDTYIMVKEPLDPELAGIDIQIMPPRMVEVTDKRKVIGEGEVILTGNREMAGTLEFIQYKAKINVNDNDIKVENSDKSVNVLYSFYEEIRPDPYFIRGDGVFSNTNNGTPRSAKILHNGTRQGETLDTLGGNYKLNLGDGEVHYILFDRKFDTASLTIGDVSFQGNRPNEMVAQKVEIEVNGVKHDAVRLYGGPDYIEYTRVMFDNELFTYCSSAFPASDNFPTTKMPLYTDNISLVNFATNKYDVKWTSVAHPATDNNGNSVEYQDYYLVKPGHENNIMSQLRPYRKIVSENVWLNEYWDDYTYYLEANVRQQLNFLDQYQAEINIDQHCRRVRVYKPVYTYNYTIYNDYYYLTYNLGSAFILTNNLQINSGTGLAYGGTFTSYHPIYDNVSIYNPTNVYEYNITELRKLYSGDNEGLAIINNINNHGLYNDSWYSSITDYNAHMFYSTIVYEIDVDDVDMNKNEVEVKYNVFKRKYVTASGEERDQNYGVHLLMTASISSTNYLEDALTGHEFNSVNMEYLLFDNIKEMRVCSGKWPAVVVRDTLAWNAPFNGLLREGAELPDSRGKPIKLGPNPSGRSTNQSIFGSDGYGPYYYYGHARYYGDDTFQCYSFACARFKKNWEGDKKVITPYYIFNRFPYRYEVRPGFLNATNYPSVNIVKISDGGGKPMPSIRKTPVNSNTGLQIQYSTYDFGNNQKAGGIININITLEKRPCHMMYNGSQTSDNYINYTAETGITEYPGEVNSFYDGQNIHSEFNEEGINAYTKIKEFLR
jgi:hypothetical protein